MKNILIIDGQGGRIGRELTLAILKKLPDANITAVGTNTMATMAMNKVGAHACATGENAVVVCAEKADVIAGPMGIIIKDALLGEITSKMAKAICKSRAKRVLIPMNNCDTLVAGVAQTSISELLQDAVEKIIDIVGE